MLKVLLNECIIDAKLYKRSELFMMRKKTLQTKDIVSLSIFIVSLVFSIYISFMLLHEELGVGQIFFSFMLIFSAFLTIFLGVGLLRHFTKIIKKSWIFYIFQFLLAFAGSILVFSLFSVNVVNQSQEKMFISVKNELTPMIARIKKYQKKYGKTPFSISVISVNNQKITNLYYYATSDNFILGTYIPSLDIDGAQIFYDSRDGQWYRFHNDTYQYYKNKKNKPKSIENYISFQKQIGVITTILKKIDGKFINLQEKAKNNSENHLKLHKKRCEENYGASCTAVGMRYGMGLEVTQSDALAFKYYKKACELDDANGCQYLAEMYKRGKGIQKDISIAKQLYEKACKLGNKSACKKGE